MNGKSAFEYKAFLSPDGKECFRYKFAESSDEFHKKAITKKDFDFTQSLLDFLYLDVEKHAKLFKTAAADAEALLETKNEKYIPRIKKSADKIAGLHIYFEHLRLDWYCRVDRLHHSNDLAKLLPYEDLANIPDVLSQHQEKAFALIENVLDFTSPDKPVQEKMVQYYSMRYGVFSMPFRFIAQTTCFEMADGAAFTEVFYPSDIYDLLSYFMRLCVEREQVFKRCKSCGDYFALTGYSTTEYCDREYGNTGKRAER